jgi:hypothetical protein
MRERSMSFSTVPASVMMFIVMKFSWGEDFHPRAL